MTENKTDRAGLIARRLRELSAWLSEHNIDMQMPEGMIDPAEAADLLDLLASRAKAEPVAWWLEAMMETCALASKHGLLSGGPRGYAHIAGMAIQADKPGFDRDKGITWLGWIQGVLEERGVVSRDEIRAINEHAKAFALPKTELQPSSPSDRKSE